MRTISVLVVLLYCAAPGLSAELLSEKGLESTTARGREDGSFESSPGGSAATVHIQNQSQITQTLQSRSQTHLKGGAVTNAAGRNQIANGINVR